MIQRISYWLFTLLLVAPAAVAQDNDKFVVYQMMIRLFGNTNTTNATYGTLEQNGVGKFSDINELALSELKAFGADYVWYTGVLEHATMSEVGGIAPDDADVVKGRAGSPYAIKDYYDVNAYLADDPTKRIEEFKALIDRTHAAGLKVLIDLVPNHVARSYKSDKAPEGVVDFGQNDDTSKGFDPNNNFYYIPGEDFVVPTEHDPLGKEKAPNEDDTYTESPAKVSGNDVFKAKPSKGDWFETIKLNYGKDYSTNTGHYKPIPQTWGQVRDIVEYWSAVGVDGFRCDMAEMVPVEFWEWMIKDVKEDFPKAIFIAEIYNPNAYEQYLFTGGFDYLYDKVGVYDALRAVIEGKDSVPRVHEQVKKVQAYDERMLRFVENHDEQRSSSPNFGNAGRAGYAMTAASILSGKGPYMHYFGQDVGERGAGIEGFQKDDGRTTIFDYWGVPAHQQWVNGGKFDGGALPDSAKALRADYIALLHMAETAYNSVLSAGDYTPLNTQDKDILAFERKLGERSLKVVINLSSSEQDWLPGSKYLKGATQLWSTGGTNTEATTLSKLSPYQVKVATY